MLGALYIKMFCMNPLGRKMVYFRPLLSSFSSTLRCQLGNDFSYLPAPIAEFSTTCLTLDSLHASIALLSHCTSCGIGEHPRNTVSTPANAFRKLALSAKSASTPATP